MSPESPVINLTKEQYDSLMDFVPHWNAGVVGPFGKLIDVRHITRPVSEGGVPAAMVDWITETCRAYDVPLDLSQWRWVYVERRNLN